MHLTVRTLALAVLLVAAIRPAWSQKTEIRYLSGTGSDQTADWQFYCTSGMNAGKWTTIPVPSNWELQGFGKYNYGHDKDSVRGKEQGLYRYRFEVPASWKGRRVDLVFEGSMTDTEARVNGKPAGPVHRGAFYRFSYDITGLLKFGGRNLLEVTVSKHSSDESVNKAERYADFWVFGGIYRPVYLEARPLQHIERVAVDARADGSFTAELHLGGPPVEGEVTARLYTAGGEQTGMRITRPVTRDERVVRLTGKAAEVKPWNPEEPFLYRVVFTLSREGKTLHEVPERIGFRTVEVRLRDGIYVNGVKVKLKGVNRHTFRPAAGRASCKAYSIEDVNLMRDMNMNAVRMSHYPPDSHFLDVCDSLGLFVLNELAGWHDAYDTGTGTILVREMVTRDVNHPSVIGWSNGNEGGTNPAFDAVFRRYDLQGRPVIHPWMKNDGITTEHYINYDYGTGTYWHGHDIVMPTEFLHGLYDGGLGAGLHDFWELIWDNPRAAGGFLWVFADEGVVRTDLGGAIDTYGNSAPDGLLGPFHEKEGSFFAVREIWSPVRFEEKEITAAFDGTLPVENRYLYTNLNRCAFSWKLAGMPRPGGGESGPEKSGRAAAPDVRPGQKGVLFLDLPGDWRSYDVLYVTATDPTGREVCTRSFPVALPADMARRLLVTTGLQPVAAEETDSLLILKTVPVEIALGRYDGLLKSVKTASGKVPFGNGPVLSGGKALFDRMAVQAYADSVVVTCSYRRESRMKEMVWTVWPSGWIRLVIRYFPPEYDTPFDFMGVDFTFPEQEIRSVRWYGDGPYRVWKNRMQGVELGVHHKEYNRTMTGVPPLRYPEFKGYHSRLYWAEFITADGSFLAGSASEDVFLRLFTPDHPGSGTNTAPPFPGGDLSFMQAIPPIGTKGQQPWRLGPSGQKNMFFDYGPYDNWRRRCKTLELYFRFAPE